MDLQTVKLLIDGGAVLMLVAGTIYMFRYFDQLRVSDAARRDAMEAARAAEHAAQIAEAKERERLLMTEVREGREERRQTAQSLIVIAEQMDGISRTLSAIQAHIGVDALKRAERDR